MAVLEAEWTTTEIIAWLTALGIGDGLAVDMLLAPGPYIPDMPDRVGVVTPTAGPGETMDGVGDISGFQLLTRGEQNQPVTAELLAHQADRRIRFSAFPIDVAAGGLRLLRVLRPGGGPAVLAMEDDGDRTSLVCTYLTEILR